MKFKDVKYWKSLPVGMSDEEVAILLWRLIKVDTRRWKRLTLYYRGGTGQEPKIFEDFEPFWQGWDDIEDIDLAFLQSIVLENKDGSKISFTRSWSLADVALGNWTTGVNVNKNL